jgi:Threonine dehydrogenase and related Zn-dependent dehydrogenases
LARRRGCGQPAFDVGQHDPRRIDRALLPGEDTGRQDPVETHQVEIVEKGLAILGSYISNFTFPAAIRLIEGGQLNVAPMISAIVGLEDPAAAIARLRSGEAVKIVVTP